MKHKYHTAKVTNVGGFIKNFGRLFKMEDEANLHPKVIDNFLDPSMLPHEFAVLYVISDGFSFFADLFLTGNKETKEFYMVTIKTKTRFDVEIETQFMLDDLKSDKPISIYEHYKNPHNENAVTTQYVFEDEAMKYKFIEMLSPFLKNAAEYVKGCKF